MSRVHPRCLRAAVPGAVLLVAPESEIEVETDDPGALLAALDAGLEEEALARAAGATTEDVAYLLDQLRAAGVIKEQGDDSPTGEALPLADALLATLAGEELAASDRRAVCTAEELLCLPVRMTRQLEREALRGFVAALEPTARQRAYCHLITWGERTVMGDLPDDKAVEESVRRASEGPEEMIRVVPLNGGPVASVEPARLRKLDCSEAHRLGPITATYRAESPPEDPSLHIHAARFVLPNLRFPDSGKRMAGGRAGDPALAELIARAEAAERFAGGDAGAHELLRAREDELPAEPLPLSSIVAYNDRQLRSSLDVAPYDPAQEHLWVEGREHGGRPRWILADAVFYPFVDPERRGRLCMATSSGTAAHTDRDEAWRRAAAELVERDAFMWTWIQRVSRELIEQRTLDEDLRARISSVRGSGLEVSLVNLSLDTLPVVLSAVWSDERLSVGISSARDPVAAIKRSLAEAVAFLGMTATGDEPRQEAAEISSPEEHARWHQEPEQIERDRFLFGSGERIDVRDIPVPDAPEAELLAAVGEPVTVDLTTVATAPFAVIRVIVPGLVPVSFGFDREPLGMQRLAQPARTLDGRELGRPLDLSEWGPVEPHPFA